MAAKKSSSPKTGAKKSKATVKKANAPKRAAKATKPAVKKAPSAKPATKKEANFFAEPQALAPFTPIGFETTKTMEDIMTNGKSQMDKIANDMTAIGKDQMEAFMKSGTIFMKGMEDIMKTCMSIAQTSSEKNSEAAKALMGCKTLNELTEAQNKIAQTNFDEFMSGATKISEMSVKVATECFEPINDQLSKSIKKASESIAA